MAPLNLGSDSDSDSAPAPPRKSVVPPRKTLARQQQQQHATRRPGLGLSLSRSPSKQSDGAGTDAAAATTSAENNADDEVDDYLTMPLSSTPTTGSTSTSTPETSLQRQARLRRERAQRAHIPSLAAREADAARRRDEALAQSALDRENRGFRMMERLGYRGGGLGRDGGGVAEPIGVRVKVGRAGVGAAAAGEEGTPGKRGREGDGVGEEEVERRVKGFRERVGREREEGRLERLMGAAQRVVEGLEGEGPTGEERVGRMPVGKVPVVWRGLVVRRVEAEREARMRREMLSRRVGEGGSSGSDGEEGGEEDVRPGTVETEDYEYEGDEELQAWDARPVEERLGEVVKYLRDKYRYCFWCKCRYPDESMDGCPGLTEEDHE